MFLVNKSDDASRIILHRKSRYNNCHHKIRKIQDENCKENIQSFTLGTFLAPKSLERVAVRGKANGLGQGQDKLGSTRG